ncbi:MAG: Hsp20/alpha crystallin family protein [Halobacteriota archaeon]
MRLDIDEVDDVQEFVDRMMLKLQRATHSLARGDLDQVLSEVTMSTDVVDHGDSLEVAVDLPGFEIDEVEVRATNSALRVSAERDEEATDSNSEYVRRERLRRSVEREITLPSEVEPDSVRAELRNGVLRVTAEKTEDTGGRRVEIKSS